MKGYFITIEGPDGAGKTTQLKMLRDYLLGKGYEVILTREPGGTPLAEKIRNLLLDPASGEICPVAEALLYAASRAQHVAEVILPSLQQGKIVLCDRFVDSSIVYQGLGRGIEPQAIIDINHFATQGITPDLTILLDLTPEQGMARLAKRNKEKSQELDRLEQESLEFYHKVRQGYLDLAKTSPERYKVIEADDSIENIQQRIVALIDKYFTI
ncbi:MAG: dTMP kinase [Zhaonellaceae bacterium]|jgi:dTMP kinase|nr:dTMP kinase [Clostridia bacterium]